MKIERRTLWTRDRMRGWLRRAGGGVLALLLLLPATSWSSEPESGTKRKGDAYPLETCPVSGEKLGAMGDPVVVVHDGREIRFCCKGCIPRFEKAPAKYLEKIDTAIVTDQKPLYPLRECLVSGKKLGAMGEPIDFVYGNRLVRFCCKGCVPAFEKDPARHLEKLDAAVVEAQKAKYPLETCVVSGKKLGAMGKPVDVVQAGRLVRLCCKGCLPALERDPAKYTAEVDAATWTCPMHPQVRQGSAGRCPVCDMKLVKGKPAKEDAPTHRHSTPDGSAGAEPHHPADHR